MDKDLIQTIIKEDPPVISQIEMFPQYGLEFKSRNALTFALPRNTVVNLTSFKVLFEYENKDKNVHHLIEEVEIRSGSQNIGENIQYQKLPIDTFPNECMFCYWPNTLLAGTGMIEAFDTSLTPDICVNIFLSNFEGKLKSVKAIIDELNFKTNRYTLALRNIITTEGYLDIQFKNKDDKILRIGNYRTFEIRSPQ